MAFSGRYHYEYQLCLAECIHPWDVGQAIERKRRQLLPQDTYGVYYVIEVKYILKKRPGQGADENLSYAESRFWWPWDYPSYDFDMLFSDYVVREDVKEELISKLGDFTNQLRADPLNADSDSCQIVVSIQIYTVQQEDETIEAAKDRAITEDIITYDFPHLDMLTRRLKFSYSIGKWSFVDSLVKIKVEDDNPGQACVDRDECCIV